MIRLSKVEFERFSASPLLAGVTEEARAAVFRRLVADHIPAGVALITQGKANQKLWFVIEGSVAIERRQANGHLDFLAAMSAPAIFGTTTFFRPTIPTASIRATSGLTLGFLDRETYEALRVEDPRTAEALTLAIIRVLSERFDMLDEKLTELMAEHGADHARANEWANFRSRLFEEPTP